MYSVVLDPSAVAVNRTMLDLNSGAIRISNAGVDWGDAAITAFETQQGVYGTAPVGFIVPNRVVTIPLLLGADDTGTEETVRANLQKKVALIQREGGWLLRQRTSGPAMYADVVNATLTLPDVYGETGNVEPSVVLQLECLPDFYGDPVTLDTTTGSGYVEGLLKLSGAQYNVPGDYPARCELQVSDTSGNNQDGMIWGLRSRHYSSGAPLFYNAGALTTLNGSTATTLTGAYGSVVEVAAPVSSAWQPILSTGQLTHQGAYRVWARCFCATDVPQFQLSWSQGVTATYETNDAASLPGQNAFYVLDLGEIYISMPPNGTPQWNGVVSIYSSADTPPAAYIDCLWLQPLDEAAGLLQWNQQGQQQSLGTISTQLNCTTGANDAAAGTVAWLHPNNIINGGSSPWAQVASQGAAAFSSEYLKANGFGFAIPAGATITGLEFQMYRNMPRSGSGVGTKWVTNKTVQLYKAGVLSGTNHASGGNWPNNAAWESIGGSSDLWGGTWTPTDINNTTGFGVAVQVHVPTTNSSQSITAQVAAIRMIVYYRLASFTLVSTDAVIFASQRMVLRDDGAWHYGPSGTVQSPMVPFGDLARIPPSGVEGRAVELLVKPSRGDFNQNPDTAIDNLSITPIVRPCWLSRP